MCGALYTEGRVSVRTGVLLSNLFINARIVCARLYVRPRSFFERLAGPFSTFVGSFESFLRFYDVQTVTGWLF